MLGAVTVTGGSTTVGTVTVDSVVVAVIEELVVAVVVLVDADDCDCDVVPDVVSVAAERTVVDVAVASGLSVNRELLRATLRLVGSVVASLVVVRSDASVTLATGSSLAF